MDKILAKDINLINSVVNRDHIINVIDSLDNRLDGLLIDDAQDLYVIIQNLKDIIRAFGGSSTTECIFEFEITEEDIEIGRNAVVIPQDGYETETGKKIEIIWE